jgi:hypothetical protein
MVIFFYKVYLNKDTCAISWSEELELCSDSVYLKLNYFYPSV